MADSTVLSIDPNFLLLDTYSVSDETLIANQEITSTFSPETDYIEYYIYGLNNSLLSPYLPEEDRNISIPYNSFSLLNGELYINPSLDLETVGFEQGSYNVIYNFYSNRLSSSFSTKYFISEISSDRTELRLDSNQIEDENIISSVTEFIAERTADEYYPDFLLNFGSNKTVIANNIALDGNTVLIKLYEPLPQQFGLKSTLWVVEEVAEPIAYNITFEEESLEEEDTSILLKGPNVNLDLKDQINNSTETISLSSLDSSPLTSSYQQLQSLFQEEGLQINVDYTEYSNFILNSSIEARLENFEYKLQLIESYTKSAQSGSNISGTTAVSGSKTYYTSLIDDVITNFDGYEYFLYFESGSKSWPKANSEPPYQNLATTDITAINWYNEQITSASLYDELNLNSNYYDVPEYLRNDSSNQGYIDFVNMIGQHFDNIWIYLKDVSNKYNADNRINAGVSKDLVAQILRDFSLKIYQNNFSSKDVYSSFLGLTPNGSLFPFPEMTGSLPTPSGFEHVDTFISSSTDTIPLDDVNKRIYKRLYHNLPYLLKSKGTTQGLKTLLNIYGIPDTILRISEFGGKDKINENDWDYWYNKFNYAYDTQNNGFISSSWTTNSEWGTSPASETVQFRFKTPGVESATTTYSQSLWSLDTNVHVVLEYTGSGLSSGSYSGAIVDPSNQYAHLKFYPDYVNNPNHSASLYLPFFDGGWWSVMATLTDSTASLYAGNKIYNGNTGTELGFYESDNILNVNSSEWDSGTISTFASESIYPKFSGSLQEIRYYNTAISESRFKDYVMNPLSFEGNSIESGSLDLTPDQLLFRATLGGELYTGSTSIHPKSAGPWPSVYSFLLDSRFNIENGDFVPNKEYIFLDQPAIGLKNRINDKIKAKSLSLPSYTTTEGAVIPSANTLSNQRSIQQDKFRNDQYTNNVDLLEVTFSPQNEINDDIIQQLGYFNIGNLIGDPREVSSSNQSYPELDKLRQDYFLKYVHENYDFNDYVRLIKFFDNSLFKQIKDFIPAKTSLASGITIKPTILERQKYPLPQAEWEDLQYSGSVKSFARDYETGSLQVVSGGNGGSMPSLAEGSITRVKIGNGGTDFDPAGTYTVTVSGGGGTGAEISIDSVDVASYQLDSGTQLLSQTAQSPPYTQGTYPNVLCSTSGLNPIRLTITVNALTQISSIIVDSDTDGFDIGDTITINGSDIGGASNSTITLPLAVLTPVGGEISAISIVNGGRGYTSFPTLTVNGSPGTGADLQVIALGGSQVVQSWGGYNITPSGSVAFTQDDAREFVNGEFSGSTILVSSGELNDENPLKPENTLPIAYKTSGSLATSVNPGDLVWNFYYDEVDSLRSYYVSEIYINEVDQSGTDSTVALSNLKAGDEITFTVNYIITPP